MYPHALWLASAQSPPPASECAHKLSARCRHARTHSRAVAPTVLSPRQQQLHEPSKDKDAFRSAAVFGQVARLESDVSREKMAPEDAFALLQRVLSAHSWTSAGPSTTRELSTPALLDALDAACWKTLDPESCRSRGDRGRAACRSEPATVRLVAQPQGPALEASPAPPPARRSAEGSNGVRIRYSQLCRGVEEAIAERRSTLASLAAALERTAQRNDELPLAIAQREGECRSLKEQFVAASAHTLGCDSAYDARRQTSSAAAAAAVDDRVRALRRRRDLRVWACGELRSAINEHMTRASELKKEITAVTTDAKKEEQAHKAKTKRVDAILAATTGVRGARSNRGDPGLSPEELVAQAQERKVQLLDAIEHRKTRLRRRTEEVFDARTDAEALELKRAAVVEKIAGLEHDIAHVERSCTPRPNWSELLEAALVTTAVDRVGKKAKLRIASSRKKMLGGADSRHDDNEDQEDGGDQRLRQILTGSWSTIEKIHAMSEELTRIRTKNHAGDTILVEQARLDHLQNEISRTLQQLDAIRTKSTE